MSTIITSNPPSDSPSWEAQYFESLASSGRISQAARRELRQFAARVSEKIPGINLPTDSARVSGAVVGSVQSGKTAAMIALAAMGLDKGYRIVVVLAGLRDDLRTQTALRFTSDLLRRGDQMFEFADCVRYTLEEGRGCHGPMGAACWSPHYAADINKDDAFIEDAVDSLEDGQSVLIVTKKNISTLSRLRELVVRISRRTGAERYPMLVLDDECDEASVAGSQDAPTPERIFEVWRSVAQQVVYLGVTATPAANLLQSVDSSLFPGDFVAVLRVASQRNTLIEYQEPNFNSRYTGGRCFYYLFEDLGRPNFLLRTSMGRAEFDGGNERPELEEALIAYFVSAAIRLMLSGSVDFDNAACAPDPHTMLIHTESERNEHWDMCEWIMRRIRGLAGSEYSASHTVMQTPPNRRLRPEDLDAWFRREQGRWEQWYTSFVSSRQILLENIPDLDRPTLPNWSDVVDVLPTVFRNVQLRVVNSDDVPHEPPLQFDSSFDANGNRQRPVDVMSIVIGGNKLSRGLTIPGLCISYFTRAARELVEDTTVQRGRWFGYRGPHLEFCRVFTHGGLATRLGRMHEHEEDLRRQIALNVSEGRSPVDTTFRFLRLADSSPTAKIGRGARGSVEIAGTRPFIDRVQMGSDEQDLRAAESNQQLALEIVQRVCTDGEPVGRTNRPSAYVLRDLAAADIASYLDRFIYSFHNPDPAVGVPVTLRDWYRAPIDDMEVTTSGFSPPSDPYLIAAYLKFWQAAFEAASTGSQFHETRASDGLSPWDPTPPPNLNLAVRFGDQVDSNPDSPFTIPLINRIVTADGTLGGRWGGHGYGSDGDEWIDGVRPTNYSPDLPRPIGMPGLALLHVISRDAEGRIVRNATPRGLQYSFDRPTFGIVIPKGGPAFHYVITDSS